MLVISDKSCALSFVDQIELNIKEFVKAGMWCMINNTTKYVNKLMFMRTHLHYHVYIIVIVLIQVNSCAIWRYTGEGNYYCDAFHTRQ